MKKTLFDVGQRLQKSGLQKRILISDAISDL